MYLFTVVEPLISIYPVLQDRSKLSMIHDSDIGYTLHLFTYIVQI